MLGHDQQVAGDASPDDVDTAKINLGERKNIFNSETNTITYNHIQWGSEYRTSPVFQWSILAGTRHLITKTSENPSICPFLFVFIFIL